MNVYVIGIFILFLTQPFIINAQVASEKNDFKVGIVNVNKILNNSKAGLRSKKILESRATQKEKIIRQKEEEVIRLRNELESSLILREEKRKEKQQLSDRLQQELKQLKSAAFKEFQSAERRYTENIFIEIYDIINRIGKEEKFDFILERAVKAMLLFSKYEMIDITDRVILEYDQLQTVPQ